MATPYELSSPEEEARKLERIKRMEGPGFQHNRIPRSSTAGDLRRAMNGEGQEPEREAKQSQGKKEKRHKRRPARERRADARRRQEQREEIVQEYQDQTGLPGQIPSRTEINREVGKRNRFATRWR